MKHYVRKSGVDALKVNYLYGNDVSENKKGGKDIVTLPPEFVSKHVIHLGDYIVFDGRGQPMFVLSEATFKATYKEGKKPAPTE